MTDERAAATLMKFLGLVLDGFSERFVRETREARASIAEAHSARGLPNISAASFRQAAEIYERRASEVVGAIDRFLRETYGARVPPDVIATIAERVERVLDARAETLVTETRSSGDRGLFRIEREAASIAANRAKRELQITLSHYEMKDALRRVASGQAGGVESDGYSVDVFISHASEDKDAVARPLAHALEARGLRVWLDEAELVIGDRLFDKIDRALSASRYGVVVLSPRFFAKNWTRRELNALAALEDGEQTKILPIWHDIDKDQVAAASPMLAAVLARKTTDGLERIADEIAAVVKR